ncbi:MAG: peroxide stress protein YaaA [Marinilabiliales bacterium]|nr:peroxide stress protein YaaA [Marinilabiliales bacterium]
MLIILSPSKTLDSHPSQPVDACTVPAMLNEARRLAGYLKKLSLKDWEQIMQVNSKLAWQNLERMAVWEAVDQPGKGNSALFAYKGEVYHGLDAGSLTPDTIRYAQDHLRILSGLYGVLAPLDLIMPYRLELGIQWRFGRYESLYHFWGDKITSKIRSDLRESGSNLLFHLASQEYSSAIALQKLRANVITPQFLEEREGSFRMITIYTKKARGMMARYLLQYGVCREDDLRGFDDEGYLYHARLSKPGSPVFVRMSNPR